MSSRGGGGTENIGSNLLAKEENDQLFYLLGPRCFTLASSVVQRFTTSGPDDTEWHKRDTGVLCLVKDNPRRSYFFRLYDINQRVLLWEHEIYNRMDYFAPRPFMHTFEGENCIVAFNFACEDEANRFYGTLMAKLETKKQKRLEKKSRSGNQMRHMTQPVPHTVLSQPTITNGFMSSSPNYLHSGSMGRRKNKHKEKKRKTKFTKADIGFPQNFLHLQHVGWDPDRGFDVDNVECPIFQEFFAKAGISEKDLEHKKTRQFIYDFINSHGGVDAMKEDIQAPKPPARTSLSSSGRTAPPLPPSRPMAPPVPGHTPPPPPPPRPSHHQTPRSAEVTPIPSETFTPPPPPLPHFSPHVMSTAPTTSSPPPPPCPPLRLAEDSLTSGDTPRNVDDPRSELMNAIRLGTTLKPVEVDTDRRPVSDTRNALLDQIRQGTQLKPVQQVQKSTISTVPPDSLAGALQKALAERAHAMQSDSSSDSTSEDDDEWEE